MSMKPGATTRPDASIRSRVRAPSSPPGGVMRAMRSPRMATSPRYHGLPDPSTIRPPVMTTSYVRRRSSSGGVAAGSTVRGRVSSIPGRPEGRGTGRCSGATESAGVASPGSWAAAGAVADPMDVSGPRSNHAARRVSTLGRGRGSIRRKGENRAPGDGRGRRACPGGDPVAVRRGGCMRSVRGPTGRSDAGGGLRRRTRSTGSSPPNGPSRRRSRESRAQPRQASARPPASR